MISTPPFVSERCSFVQLEHKEGPGSLLTVYRVSSLPNHKAQILFRHILHPKKRINKLAAAGRIKAGGKCSGKKDSLSIFLLLLSIILFLIMRPPPASLPRRGPPGRVRRLGHQAAWHDTDRSAPPPCGDVSCGAETLRSPFTIHRPSCCTVTLLYFMRPTFSTPNGVSIGG